MRRLTTMKMLCAAIGVLMAASTAFAAIKTEVIDYTHNGVALRGYLAYDDSSTQKRPGVLVVHEWWGHNEYARTRAEQLAKLGYVAFALDMYGAGVGATTAPDAQKLATPFYQDRGLMRSRAAAGLKVLAEFRLTDATRLASIGYCMGGTVSLELARSGADLKGVVSFHGGLATPNTADGKNIKAKVLVCNGYDDPMVSMEERAAFHAEMKAAGVDYAFIDYGGAVHAFTNPKADSAGIPGVAYNAAADRRSWEHMKQFLAEVFTKN